MNGGNQKRLEQETLDHVANALWARDFGSANVPMAVKRKLAAHQNSPQAFGARTAAHVDWLLTQNESFHPDYRRRYEILKAHSKRLTPHQAYVISSDLLGADSAQGYDPVPATVELEFPRDHAPQLRTQVGWHFIVGSAWDDHGQEYGIECMFFRYALLPPELAKKHGLTDLENQVIELQLGISEAGGRHYQADPVLLAGTTGLLKTNADPLLVQHGKNRLKAARKGSLWPLRLQAWGLEKSGQGTELEIDLTFTGGKGILPQGDNGAMPAIDGTGSWYYSIPNLVLKPGSTVQIGTRKATLKKGSFWFDHQWGFLSGSPRSAVMRAAGNLGAPSPGGWDWFMAQFSGNRQLTMFSLHTDANRQFYFQDGDTPPGTMTVDVAGKYMDATGKMALTRGTLTVDKWVKSEQTPNPADYPVTGVWHPDRWKFEFDAKLPRDIRKFTMTPIVETGQTNYFANAAQYSEGAVYLKDPAGTVLGRGFAESVQYADTIDTSLALAGLDSNLKKVMTSNRVGPLGRLKSFWYVLRHKAELTKIMKAGKGLEYMSSPGATHSKPRRR